MFSILHLGLFSSSCLPTICPWPSRAGRLRHRCSTEMNGSLRPFNAYLLSPIFKCAMRKIASCLLQINGKTEAQAKKLADTILKDARRRHHRYQRTSTRTPSRSSSTS